MSAWKPVASTCLRAVRYDKERDRLDLEFRKSGKRYSAAGVSGQRARALLQADSPGAYFTRNIRNRYEIVPLSGGGKGGKKR